MRLHDFILTNREQILIEWDTFARTCAPASVTMDLEALRDHASEVLTVIAADLETYQSALEQSEKSKGHARDTHKAGSTPAEEHGAERAESGFTVAQMASEYRALRASVLRLWTRDCGELTPADIVDLTRFNEAIDQSLVESIAEFIENVEHAKEMFLAILGHDLRNPLGAIYTSALFMYESGEVEEPHRALTLLIAEGAKRATQMVGDLLDFTRGRLGGGIPIKRAEVNLREIVHDVVAEIMAANPERKVEVDKGGEQIGQWDAARISQALTNLVGNAAEHAAPGTAVRVELGGGDQHVAIMIHNRGAPISADRLDGIFNPMKLRAMKPPNPSTYGPTGNLGLGLYIAERIVHAHGGRIAVESSEARGTIFTVHLPRSD